MNSGQIFAIFVCAVIVMLAAFLIWWIFETRATLLDRKAAADRDGTITQAWLRDLHHAEQPALPAAGRLAFEPVPPPAETKPQPVIKDVEACELGMSTTEYVDMLIEKYAEATS